MKLVLDEMLPASVASTLRGDGFDVIAVTEHDELRGLADTGVLAVALLDARAVVTDNAVDFLRATAAAHALGEACASVVVLSSSELNRNLKSFPAALLRALTELLNEPRIGPVGEVWYL